MLYHGAKGIKRNILGEKTGSIDTGVGEREVHTVTRGIVYERPQKYEDAYRKVIEQKLLKRKPGNDAD